MAAKSIFMDDVALSTKSRDIVSSDKFQEKKVKSS